MSLPSLTGEAGFHLRGFNNSGAHTEKEGISVASLLEELASSLDSNTLGQLGKQAGIGGNDISGAVQAALPAILGGLTRNAGRQDGAAALNRALEKDHDGSALDNLGGLLGNQDLLNQGQKILGHVFGQNQGTVARGLGQASNQSSDSMGQLLAMLAPVVMGMLGRKQRQESLDSGSLADMLNQEKDQYATAQPQATDFLGSLLDADGDGDVDMADLLKKGPGLLGGLFGGR